MSSRLEPVTRLFARAQEQLSRLAREHYWNLASTLGARAAILVLYAVVVRYFLNTGSAADFATISLLLLMFSYIQLLDLGIGYAVTQRFGRAIATGDANAPYVLSAALPVYLICAGAASLTLVAIAAPLSWLIFNTDEQTNAIRLLGIGVWPLFLSAFVSSILQAMNKLVWINLSRMIVEACKAGAFLYAATAAEPVATAVAITVAGAFVRLALDVAIARRIVRSPKAWIPRFSQAEMRLNFSLGWPMVVALLLGIANTLLDRIFVSRVLGAEALADYTIGYDVNSKAFFLVGAVAAALYTPILRRSATARSHRPLLLLAYASVMAVTVAYFVPIGAFAEPILAWWINPAIASSAGSVTRIGAIMGVTYLTMSVAFNSLQAAGQARTIMIGTIVAFAVMIGGFVLMPRNWGAEGVMSIVTLGFLAQYLFYMLAMRTLPS